MIHVVTKDNINDLANGDRPLVLDFYADWCGPCKMLAPVLDSLADKHEEAVAVGKVNVDLNPDLSTQYGVTNLPTMLLIKNGEVVSKLVGFKPAPELEAFMLQ